MKFSVVRSSALNAKEIECTQGLLLVNMLSLFSLNRCIYPKKAATVDVLKTKAY